MNVKELDPEKLTAIVHVWDKKSLKGFQALHWSAKWQILATKPIRQALLAHHVPSLSLEEYTSCSRVEGKLEHGITRDHDKPKQRRGLIDRGIIPIDLLVVQLPPVQSYECCKTFAEYDAFGVDLIILGMQYRIKMLNEPVTENADGTSLSYQVPLSSLARVDMHMWKWMQANEVDSGRYLRTYLHNRPN